MNLLQGILSLVLITSSSVLCRRIQRPEIGDGAPKELSNLPQLIDKEIFEEEEEGNRDNVQPDVINVETSTPVDDLEIEENIAVPEKLENESFDNEGKLDNPISKKRIQKMLKKAIIQIITGDLTTADMVLLKSLNFDAEQVRMIREEELRKRKNHQDSMEEKRRARNRDDYLHGNRNLDDDFRKPNDYEEFNNQATLDYENAASNFEATNGSWIDSVSEYEDSSKSSTEVSSMTRVESRDPKIVFTISYNDSEFDSRSEENARFSREENRPTMLNGTGNNFPAALTSVNSTAAPVDDDIGTLNELWSVAGNYFSTTEDPIEDNDVNSQTIPSVDRRIEDAKLPVNSTELPEQSFRYKNVENSSSIGGNYSGILLSVATLSPTTESPDATSSNLTSNENGTIISTRYKGLKWVQDHVYQVLPEYIDAPSELLGNDTSDFSYDDSVYHNFDDVAIKIPRSNEEHLAVDQMTNDAPDSTQLPRSISNVSVENFADLAAYHRIITARQTQRQKTEDDIKSRVLAFTGRLNTTGTNNPLQPHTEKLAMYSPTCGIPRNTDTDLWQDSYTMNMYFQPNLTSDQHLVAAKLRIYKLPQENSTASTTSVTSISDGVENEEKKIRISVYYYARALKKNRQPRKRLMDSKVYSLTETGEQIALDVKDAERHWRPRNSNHGLVVLVEDQEGHPLQPSHYIQRANCQSVADSGTQDDKAYQRFPALFIGACTRYVRVVNEQEITEQVCGPQSDRVSSQDDRMQYVPN